MTSRYPDNQQDNVIYFQDPFVFCKAVSRRRAAATQGRSKLLLLLVGV